MRAATCNAVSPFSARLSLWSASGPRRGYRDWPWRRPPGARDSRRGFFMRVRTQWRRCSHGARESAQNTPCIGRAGQYRQGHVTCTQRCARCLRKKDVGPIHDARTLYFAALIFAAIALVPTGAHVFELVSQVEARCHRVSNRPADLQRLVAVWRGHFLRAGINRCPRTRLRHHATAFTPALIALLCIVGIQVIFWSLTFPRRIKRRRIRRSCRPTGPTSGSSGSLPRSVGLSECSALAALVVSVLRYASVDSK